MTGSTGRVVEKVEANFRRRFSALLLSDANPFIVSTYVFRNGHQQPELCARLLDTLGQLFGARGIFDVYIAEGVLNLVDTPLSYA